MSVTTCLTCNQVLNSITLENDSSFNQGVCMSQTRINKVYWLLIIIFLLVFFYFFIYTKEKEVLTTPETPLPTTQLSNKQIQSLLRDENKFDEQFCREITDNAQSLSIDKYVQLQILALYDELNTQFNNQDVRSAFKLYYLQEPKSNNLKFSLRLEYLIRDRQLKERTKSQHISHENSSSVQYILSSLQQDNLFQNILTALQTNEISPNLNIQVGHMTFDLFTFIMLNSNDDEIFERANALQSLNIPISLDSIGILIRMEAPHDLIKQLLNQVDVHSFVSENLIDIYAYSIRYEKPSYLSVLLEHQAPPTFNNDLYIELFSHFRINKLNSNLESQANFKKTLLTLHEFGLTPKFSLENISWILKDEYINIFPDITSELQNVFYSYQFENQEDFINSIDIPNKLIEELEPKLSNIYNNLYKIQKNKELCKNFLHTLPKL